MALYSTYLSTAGARAGLHAAPRFARLKPDTVPLRCIGMAPREGHMAIRIRRRGFIVTLGSMAVARPLAPQVRARGLRKLLWGLSIAAAAIGNAEAQQYPSRPITIVVPGAAGGPGDALARLVAEPMRASLGQQIIIENVSGANGTIGTARVVRAAADDTHLAWGIGTATWRQARSILCNTTY